MIAEYFKYALHDPYVDNSFFYYYDVILRLFHIIIIQLLDNLDNSNRIELVLRKYKSNGRNCDATGSKAKHLPQYVAFA